MSGFDLVSSVINEAIGEYPELDKRIASFWKSTFDGIKGVFTPLFKNPVFPKETKMVQNVVRGPKIIVRATPSTARNAFVIPGLIPTDFNYIPAMRKWKKDHKAKLFDNQYDTIPPWCFMMMNSISHLKGMRKFKLTPDKNGKKKIIFPSSDIQINIFVTRGTLTHMDPDSRMGIYLHELGHWVDAAAKIPKQLLIDPEREKIYAAYSMMAQRANTRYQEFDADDFAKQMGYGNELAKGLDQLIDKRAKIHFMAKLDDWMMRSMVEWDNKFEEQGKKFDTLDYPSIQRRKEWLKDEKK